MINGLGIICYASCFCQKVSLGDNVGMYTKEKQTYHVGCVPYGCAVH